MSREFKYRAWHKAAQKMFHSTPTTLNLSVREQNDRHVYSPVSFHLGKLDVERTIDYEDETPVVENLLVLMQYTGLRDKNGVEIYEGDVVDQHSWKPSIKDTKRQVIEWQGSGLKMRRIDGSVAGFGDLPNERLEVIGNIYENPDLLK